MSVTLNNSITLLQDSTEGKSFVFADKSDTGSGQPFIVQLVPHDQQFFNKAYSKCTAVKFKRGRRDEVLDEERFEKMMVKYYVRGWSGFTIKTLRKYLAFKPAGNLNDTDIVEFNEDNLTFLWNHSLEFRRYVNDIVMDPEQFSELEETKKNLDENFTNTSVPTAVKE